MFFFIPVLRFACFYRLGVFRRGVDGGGGRKEGRKEGREKERNREREGERERARALCEGGGGGVGGRRR